MIALVDARIGTTLGPRQSRAAMLSVGLHLLLLSVWILAPQAKPDAMGAGAMTVQLLMEPPPPKPEPEPAKPQPAPQPKPIPKTEPAKAAPKPVAAAKPIAPAAPVMSETAAPPVADNQPEAAPETSTAPAAVATPPIAIGNPAARQAERDDYLRMVWTRVMRFRPERITLTGTAVLRFTLAADGSLVNASVADSSGSGLLDRAALNALERAAPFPVPPSSVGDSLTFEIPFTFRAAR